jgi:hypothetical protein
MKINDKYIEALRSFSDWATVSDWALKVSEMFPEELEKADKQAAEQKNETTGLREIAARIGSRVSKDNFKGLVESDNSERPRKVRITILENMKNREERDLEDDIEPITRREKIKEDIENLTIEEKFRLNEFETSIGQLNKFFGTDFELEHAKALMNREDPGNHHPDNIQILIKAHNARKNNKNWERFSYDEQIEYIRSIITIQKLLSKKMNIVIDDNVLEKITNKLKSVY